jgi:dihydroflavonol-4-reductase
MNRDKRRLVKICFPGEISFCHARDVARAHLQAYERGHRGERYVLGGTHTTWQVVFEKVAQCMGITSKIHRMPEPLLYAVAYLSAAINFVTGKKLDLTPQLVKLVRYEPDITYYDKQKAKDQLGYESRSLDVMTRDCYDWLVKEGRI